ncbi:Hypothetical protein, putative [Bodo saltans]|uniref:Uncharacterized protein n=1 Tax=Bodo saltans TaxID=75058 RepID=A0A0S4JFW1_BODSA|nr:Hypothetical protein, putative [Bodo saltans]|eukprot:CUG89066.1 Hypothetical protein, putative [Bodo saltans]
MGIPELLKFIAKTTPNALFKVPCGSIIDHHQLQHFDYVLVDATNLAQTIGFKRLVSVLTTSAIRVNVALVFVFDSQRRRVGTSREHRTIHTTQDFELLVHKIADEIRTSWKARGGSKVPEVLMSGRDVAGEADYKMLHMQRSLTTAAAASGKSNPSFLLVSEDSDVLCGALCGPCPQRVTLATTLQDTTTDLCMLSLQHVLAYVGQCADVLLYADAALAAETTAASISAVAASTTPTTHDNEEEQPTTAAINQDDEAGRRKKKDGPMVATGTKMKLDDSDDDDEEVAAPILAKVSAPVPVAAAPAAVLASNQPTISAPSLKALEVASHLRHVCVDFVFLFTMIMGNNNNVPALARGATKVDIQTCWQLYCRKKYSTDPMTGEDTVNTLLSVTSGSKKNDWKAYVKLNTTFLSNVLHNINYSDHLSRPPVLEERERAMKYLARAVTSTVRYVVACHVDGAPPLQVGDKQFRCYLDTRHDGAEEDLTPSLAALFAVLADETSHTFIIPMRGEAVVTPAHSAPQFQAPSNFGRQQQETDIDSNLVVLDSTNRGAARRCNFAHLTGSTSWKTVASSVDTLTKHLPSSCGQYERLDQSWSSLTASSGLDAIQLLARGVAKIIRAQQAKKGNNQKKKKDAKSEEAPTNDIPTVYSFELRRMAPVYSATPATAADKDPSVVAASKLALMKAAGISFGYTVAPAEPPQNSAAHSDYILKPKPTKPNKTPAGTSKPTPAQSTAASSDAASPNAVSSEQANSSTGNSGSHKPSTNNAVKKAPGAPKPAGTPRPAGANNNVAKPAAVSRPATSLAEGESEAAGAPKFKRLGKKERMKLKRQREEAES